MIDFFDITSIEIPEGKVVKITAPNGVAWSNHRVSLILQPPQKSDGSNLEHTFATVTIKDVTYPMPKYGEKAKTLYVPKGATVKYNVYPLACTNCGEGSGDVSAYNNGKGVYGTTGLVKTYNDKNQVASATYTFVATEDKYLSYEVGKIGCLKCNEPGYADPGYRGYYYTVTLDVANYTTIAGLNLSSYDCVYVSLGDSIAAGHSLRYFNSGTDTQIGTTIPYVGGERKTTEIEANSYTALIRSDLDSVYNTVAALSFAQSGDTIEDLLEKLENDTVKNALKYADIVTICIGANNILIPAIESLADYVINGKVVLDELEAEIDSTIMPSATTLYTTLFDKLRSLNPDAKFIFTTVYNPYKCLHLKEGADGFFGSLIDLVEDFNILGWEVGKDIRDYFLGLDIVKTIFERANAIGPWTEKQVNKLNSVLAEQIKDRTNFYLADTKAKFDTYTTGEAYSDLVNVGFYAELDVAEVDWGALWRGVGYYDNWLDYWIYWAEKYTSSSGFDIEGFAEKQIGFIVEKVILPNVDPHPKAGGHKVLRDAFIEYIDLE